METTEEPKSAAPLSWKKILQALVIVCLGIVSFVWLSYAPPGLLGKADAIGYAVCHRIEVRSFHLGERQLPLCARCTGQYLGAVLGLVYFSLVYRRRSSMPPAKVMVLLAFFLLAYALDGINSYLHLAPLEVALPGLPRLYQPSNALRLVTGTGLGIAIAAILYPAFNGAMFREPDPRPVLGKMKHVFILICLGIGLDLIVLTENPIILYPLSLVSAAGVIILLAMVYSIALAMVLKLENRFDRPSQMAALLAASCAVAILQILVIDWFRYQITGTWGSFILG